MTMKIDLVGGVSQLAFAFFFFLISISIQVLVGAHADY
jgi:hypothetical protein